MPGYWIPQPRGAAAVILQLVIGVGCLLLLSVAIALDEAIPPLLAVASLIVVMGLIVLIYLKGRE